MRSAPTCAPVPRAASKTVRDWRGTGATDHFVQFYRTDEYLIECLAGYVADGIWNRQTAIVIATPGHRIALEERLRSKGVDVIRSSFERQFLAFDASEMLAKFMVCGRPERAPFMKALGDLMRRVATQGRPVRAFGEMVALLWGQGNRAGAIELEQLWNELARKHAFQLFCAYPAAAVEAKGRGPALEHICGAHSCVISLSA